MKNPCKKSPVVTIEVHNTEGANSSCSKMKPGNCGQQKEMMQAHVVKASEWGGDGGTEFDLGEEARLLGIRIGHGDAINSIAILRELQGNPEWTPQYGGPGGVLEEIILQPEDYINSIEGYYGIYEGKILIRSLTFGTDKGDTFGPYGRREGTAFSLPLVLCCITSFYGRSSTYLDRIGVYVRKLSIKKGEMWGGDGGSPFDLGKNPGRLRSIKIGHGDVIDSISFLYEKDGVLEWTTRYGGPGGSVDEINLEADDYVTSMEGYEVYHVYYGRVVTSLTFRTHQGLTCGPYGSEGWGVEFRESPVVGPITSFYGRAGSGRFKYLNSIGIYVMRRP